ncbi:MAG: guanylate kinase [Lachnospiraceae bacterium]|nr:guanylate kinase [Lachnospiraceae bacterium]
MGKIICLMGKSSSGKDTIYKRLLEQDNIKLKEIVTYTTRPIRAGEQDGVEYHFTDEAGYRQLLDAGSIIETRVYNTCNGEWRYFTAVDKDIDLSLQSYIMITTLEGYKKIREFYGKEKVIPVMIELDDGIRLQRALDREKIQDAPKYEEMCRRFLADAEDFSLKNLEEAEISQKFNNNDDLEQCLFNIMTYLKANM